MGPLRTNPRVRLAAQEAVSLDIARDVLGHNPDLSVIVLVGFDASTGEIVASLREVRPAIKIVSFPVIGTHFSINLPHPDLRNILGIFDRPVTVATLEVTLTSPHSPLE